MMSPSAPAAIAARAIGATLSRIPVPCEGSTITGRCDSRCATGTALMSRVLRVEVAQRLSHLPVIVDPSHSGGRRDLVLPLTRAAIAVGADGVIVDIHPEPKMALCDGDQALVESDIREIASIAAHLSPLMGRTLTPAPELAATTRRERLPSPVG